VGEGLWARGEGLGAESLERGAESEGEEPKLGKEEVRSLHCKPFDSLIGSIGWLVFQPKTDKLRVFAHLNVSGREK